MLRDSIAVVAVVRTRPRALPLPMITMRKSLHGFLFPIWLWGSAYEVKNNCCLFERLFKVRYSKKKNATVLYFEKPFK